MTQLCGHDERFIVRSDEGTAFCLMCEHIALKSGTNNALLMAKDQLLQAGYEIDELTNLCLIAQQTMTVIDEWLGSASTRQAATDSMWRLTKALEAAGFKYENRHILDWRGSILKELNDAGFYPNSDNAYAADTRFMYDPDAPNHKRIFGNAVGLTLKEVIANWQQLSEEWQSEHTRRIQLEEQIKYLEQLHAAKREDDEDA